MKSLSMTRAEFTAMHLEFRQAAEQATDHKERIRWNQAALHLCDRMRTEARMLDSELAAEARADDRTFRMLQEAREPYKLSEDEKRAAAAGPVYPGSEPGSWAQRGWALQASGARVVQQIHDEIMIEVPTNADVDSAQRALRAATVDPERTYREGYATALREVARSPKFANHLTNLTDDQVKHWYGAAPLPAGEYKKMKASRAASDREIPGTAAGMPGYQTEGKTAWRPGEHLFMGADGRVRPIRVCMDPAAKPMDSGTMPLGFADDGAPVYLDRATGLISTGLLSTRPENIQNHRIRGGHSHVATASAAAEDYLRPGRSLNPEQVGEVLREAKRKASLEATPEETLEEPEAARMARLWGPSR